MAGVGLDMSKCIECGQCTNVCPTGTLHEREEWQDVLKLLDNKRKVRKFYEEWCT
jgi:formate hydrogenlyase subunit 6/NADH:ubiquinone oxidoreductase subunit I